MPSIRELRLGGGGLVRRGDVHAAIVLDIDLHAGFVDDLVDHLAAGADDLADLVRIDGEADDLGRVLGQMRARRGQRLQHFAEDVHAAVIRLGERLAQDRLVDALDLDVHLDGGDALVRYPRP